MFFKMSDLNAQEIKSIQLLEKIVKNDIIQPAFDLGVLSLEQLNELEKHIDQIILSRSFPTRQISQPTNMFKEESLPVRISSAPIGPENFLLNNVSVATDPGYGRTKQKVNLLKEGKHVEHSYSEDSYGVSATSSKGRFFTFVCDGHGAKGFQVSQLVSHLTILNYSRFLRDANDNAHVAISNLIKFLDIETRKKFNRYESGGTTFTFVDIDLNKNKLTFANLGDSPAVLIRNYNVIAETKDHDGTNLEEIERVRKIGNGWHFDKDGKGTFYLYRNNVKGPMPSRGFGDFQYDEAIGRTPDIFEVSFQPNDLLLLSSDGLYEVYNPTNRMFSANREIRMPRILNDLKNYTGTFKNLSKYLINQLFKSSTIDTQNEPWTFPNYHTFELLNNFLKTLLDNQVVIVVKF